VEPYAGGASVALFLLLEGYVSKITINDIDRSIYAFWHSVLYDTDNLCKLIRETKIDIPNWRKQKEIQKNKKHASLLELGFSTFFLNRTNVSGILHSGGAIGGVKQNGPYKLDCRFNKVVLIERIKTIAQNKNNISLFNLDALELVKKIKKEKESSSSSIFYFDPPYYLKGESLYMNYYDNDDHEGVNNVIKKIKSVHWIVSYDDVPQIRKMYSEFRKKRYTLLHSAYNTRIGKEVLFFSNGLKIPRIANPIRA
jgi:DNA adenine methylase